MVRRLSWIVAASAASCVAGSTQRLADETLRMPSVQAAAAPREASREEEASLEAPVTRERVLALVVARDPGLTARARRARAMLHAARAEGSLPPPELDTQVWNLPLARPYALGEASMYMVQVRQMFPAPGSLDARSRAMVEEARAMAAELAAREQEVAWRAAQAYADYAHGALDHRVHTEHLALLAEMLDATRRRLAAGGAALRDVARVETEQAQTRRRIARIDGEIARARAALNALLLRPHRAPIGPPTDLDPYTVDLPEQELLARSMRANGMLARARARVGAAQARSEAARAESRWPQFSTALGYWQDPQMRPGLGASVAMTIPWLWSGPGERAGEARENEAAEAASAREAAVDVRSEVGIALERLRALEREHVVLRAQSRPAAERSLDAIRSAYVTGGATLLDWLDASRTLLDVAMEEAEVTSNLAHAAADLERAVGERLPRTPTHNESEAAR